MTFFSSIFVSRNIAVLTVLLSYSFAQNDECTGKHYPAANNEEESGGVYTGERENSMMMMFKLKVVEVLTCRYITFGTITFCLPIYEKALVRDVLPSLCKKIENQPPCLPEANKTIWGISDMRNYTDEKFMAIWTIPLPSLHRIKLNFQVTNFTNQDRIYTDYERNGKREHSQIDTAHLYTEFEVQNLQNKSSAISVVLLHHSQELPFFSFTYNIIPEHCTNCSCEQGLQKNRKH